MNVIKKYFTLKRIVIFFGVVFAALFFIGECSFKYMDWQYYVARDMCKNESGYYIYDEKLYKETEKTNYNAHLSNGYRLQLRSGYGLYENEKIMRKFYYIDSHNKECLISKLIAFEYISYGLWLQGDEGRGFWIETKEILDILPQENIYVYGERK